MFYSMQECHENHRCTIFLNNIRIISFNIYKMFLYLKELLICYGLLRWLRSEEFACQCRSHKRHGLDLWVRKMPWRRKCHPTQVFLPGKFHGQKSLVGYSPWGRQESDRTQQLSIHMLHILALCWLLLLSFLNLHKSD